MAASNNDKSWYKTESGGLEIETDPQSDAKAAQEKSTEQAGVKFVGGGSHGKTDKGVKRVSRRGSE